MAKIAVFLAVFILCAVGMAFAEYNLSYVAAIHESNGALVLDSLKLADGDGQARKQMSDADEILALQVLPEHSYLVKVLSSEGKTLYRFLFITNPSTAEALTRDMVDENGNVIPQKASSAGGQGTSAVVLVMPYFRNAKSIDIYGQGGALALSIDVSKYSRPQDSGSNAGGVLSQFSGISPLFCFVPLALLAIIAAIAWYFLGRKKKALAKEDAPEPAMEEPSRKTKSRGKKS